MGKGNNETFTIKHTMYTTLTPLPQTSLNVETKVHLQKVGFNTKQKA